MSKQRRMDGGGLCRLGSGRIGGGEKGRGGRPSTLSSTGSVLCSSAKEK